MGPNKMNNLSSLANRYIWRSSEDTKHLHLILQNLTWLLLHLPKSTHLPNPPFHLTPPRPLPLLHSRSYGEILVSKKRSVLNLISLHGLVSFRSPHWHFLPHSTGVRPDLHGWLYRRIMREAFTTDHTNTIPQCRSHANANVKLIQE